MAAGSTSDATNLEINVNAGFLAQIMGKWGQSELVHVAGIGKLIVLGVLEAILSEVIYFEDCLDAIGVPQSRVELILESLRQGDALVTIQASEGDFEKVSEILCRHKPVDVESRAQQWRKRGWRGFDAMFDPYTVEEIIRKKRQYIPPRTNNRAECIDRVLQQYRVNAAQDS
jgi:hypothetical protein